MSSQVNKALTMLSGVYSSTFVQLSTNLIMFSWKFPLQKRYYSDVMPMLMQFSFVCSAKKKSNAANAEVPEYLINIICDPLYHISGFIDHY